jgi:hypothetical protein
MFDVKTFSSNFDLYLPSLRFGDNLMLRLVALPRDGASGDKTGGVYLSRSTCTGASLQPEIAARWKCGFPFRNAESREG